MPSPELQVTAPELSPVERLRQQALQELAWDARELESMLLPEDQRSTSDAQAVKVKNLERIHTCLSALAEGREGIPEETDEEEILDLVGDLRRIYTCLEELHAGYTPPEDPLTTPEALHIARRIVGALAQLSGQEGVENSDILKALYGLDTAESIDLRRQLLEISKKTTDPAKKIREEDVLKSLSGLSCHEAQKMREHFLHHGAQPIGIIVSLCDVSTPESLELRLRLATDAHLPAIAFSLHGIDTPASIALRNALLAQGASAQEILYSLFHTTSPESLALREQLSPKPGVSQEHIVHYLRSLAGNASPRAMKLRQPFFRTTYQHNAFESLRNVNTDCSARLRRKYLESDITKFGKMVAASLPGVNTNESMEWRLRLLQSEAVDPMSILQSLEGVTSPAAIPVLKEIYLSPRTILLTKDKVSIHLKNHGSQESMELRKHILRSGGKRQVLQSLAFVDTPESYRFRGLLYENLRISAEELLQSLVGVSTSRAMKFREGYASQTEVDLTPVAESLVGVYTPESFAFRKQHFSTQPKLYLRSLFHTGLFSALDYDKALKRGIMNAVAASTS